MTLTAGAVEAALQEKFEDEGEHFWSEIEYYVKPSKWAPDRDNLVTIDDIEYEIEVVEADTGGEGHGEYVFVVVKVGNQLFRKEGYYASHYGTDWDGDFEEVESFEKTVTDYRAV